MPVAVNLVGDKKLTSLSSWEKAFDDIVAEAAKAPKPTELPKYVTVVCVVNYSDLFLKGKLYKAERNVIGGEMNVECGQGTCLHWTDAKYFRVLDPSDTKTLLMVLKDRLRRNVKRPKK